MSLTRKLLKDMQLTDAQIEMIIAAHVATMEGLKAERDASAAELDALRSQLDQALQSQQSAAEVQAAFDAYRTQVESTRRSGQALKLLRLSLIQAGCNEKAVDLMISALDPSALELENGMLKNADAIIGDMRAKYAAFFAQPVRMPVPSIQPPVPAGGALTREDISRMSADEINRNWNAVKGVLSKGAI